MTDLIINQNNQELTLLPSGDWTLANFSRSEELCIQALNRSGSAETVVIDISEANLLDSSGSLLLIDLMQKLLRKDSELQQNLLLRNFSSEQQALFEMVFSRISKFRSQQTDTIKNKKSLLEPFSKLGFAASNYLSELFNFLGQVGVAFLRLLKNPSLFRPKEVFSQLEEACVKSIPVAVLVTFLIGVVVAYLMALQLEKYGGNIFVVNGVALAMCREMSPVIVALVMAGRSGSAYTAQIGAMKLNEEVDAITTLGLSVQQVLVIPRIIALMISMPLLVFIGDLAGMLGGMIVADSFLGISYPTFIERLKTALPPRHFVAGMIKAPVYAAVIAIIGCRRGLSTEMNARSVGLSTTATVVESIVLVIILNAAFAVIFAQLGI